MNEKIMIAILGRDDAIRTLYPAKRLNVDKIYLFIRKGQEAFPNEIIKARELARSIVEEKNFFIQEIDYYDIFNMIKGIADSVKKEIQNGNNIYCTISGGTMMTAASIIACQYLNMIPVFAKFDYIKNELTDVEKLDIPIGPFINLDQKLYDFLEGLSSHPTKTKHDENKLFTKRECLDIIIHYKIDSDIKTVEPNTYNKLNSRYLNYLEKYDLIKLQNEDKGKIQLTKLGDFIGIFKGNLSISENQSK